MKLRHYLVFSAIPLLFIAAFLIHRLSWPNRVVIRNSSGTKINNVSLRVESLDGKWELVRELQTMNNGKIVVFRHCENDIRGGMTFNMAGENFAHSEFYIDLWTGEGWLFDVQPDGSVYSSYDYSLRK